MDEAWTPHRCFCPHWASVHCLDVRHIICDLLQCIPKDLAAYGVIYRFNELISQKPGITMSLGKNTDNYSIFFWRICLLSTWFPQTIVMALWKNNILRGLFWSISLILFGLPVQAAILTLFALVLKEIISAKYFILHFIQPPHSAETYR